MTTHCIVNTLVNQTLAKFDPILELVQCDQVEAYFFLYYNCVIVIQCVYHYYNQNCTTVQLLPGFDQLCK